MDIVDDTYGDTESVDDIDYKPVETSPRNVLAVMVEHGRVS